MNKKTAIILISAGHTDILGKDRGAAGNGIIEGIEACVLRDSISDELRQRIREAGLDIKVIEDGADGDNDPLTKAVALARGADIAIEIHFNASEDFKASGVECLARETDKQLAQNLAFAVSAATNLQLRGSQLGYRPKDSGQHHRLAFIDDGGGVILEVCFLSNPMDALIYKRSRDAICRNVADFILSQISLS